MELIIKGYPGMAIYCLQYLLQHLEFQLLNITSLKIYHLFSNISWTSRDCWQKMGFEQLKEELLLSLRGSFACLQHQNMLELVSIVHFSMNILVNINYFIKIVFAGSMTLGYNFICSTFLFRRIQIYLLQVGW